MLAVAQLTDAAGVSIKFAPQTNADSHSPRSHARHPACAAVSAAEQAVS